MEYVTYLRTNSRVWSGLCPPHNCRAIVDEHSEVPLLCGHLFMKVTMEDTLMSVVFQLTKALFRSMGII